MNLQDVRDILLIDGGDDFKTKVFNHKRLDPDHLFKPIEKLDLAYTTVTQFKDCKIRFVFRKFLDMNFFKTGEALFLGNLVHKYAEELITAYSTKAFKLDIYNEFAKKIFEAISNKFNKMNYSSTNEFVESTFKYVMSRKKFEPDVFFDDLSFIRSVCEKSINYVDCNKIYFRNTAILMKTIFAMAIKVNAGEFQAEKWFKFPINGLPAVFTGKMDLYFRHNYNGEKGVCIIDFKTGKKEYFHSDQLHYYALYFGEEMFDRIYKYFFDIKLCDKYLISDKVDYQSTYQKLYDMCSEINDLRILYNNEIQKLREKYEKELNNVLENSNKNNIQAVPYSLVYTLFELLNKDFFKSSKIKDYHSEGGFTCNFCDVLGICSIRA